MEKVLEKTERKLSEKTSERTLERTLGRTSENAVEYDADAALDACIDAYIDAYCDDDFDLDAVLGEAEELEFDENGEPIGYCTPEELFDELDRKFVATFGEEGRRMANARRERWNRTGPWHFEMF
ncbi:MAG: hypothetical protein LBC98_09345 [Prevotellaceae bacterium]|nr:hypothetical protein [Prevotellaceae bacterium]